MSGNGVQRELTRNQKVEAALGNELLTRARVDRLEGSRCVMDRQIRRLEAILGRDFRGRLRWLLFGR